MRRKKDRAVESVGRWGQLAHGRDAESHARGTLIYAPGQESQELLLLSGGQVALYLLSPEGRVLTLRVVEAGQLFGQVAVADGGAYDSFAGALTPVRLYRIARADVLQMIDRDSTLGLALLEDLGQHRMIVSRLLEIDRSTITLVNWRGLEELAQG